MQEIKEKWVQSLGREESLEGGHGNPFQYSCLENSMDRGAWWATVHRVTQSWTWLSNLACMHATCWVYQQYIVIYIKSFTLSTWPKEVKPSDLTILNFLFIFCFLGCTGLCCSMQASLVAAHGLLSSCDPQAQQSQHTGLVASRHVGS